MAECMSEQDMGVATSRNNMTCTLNLWKVFAEDFKITQKKITMKGAFGICYKVQHSASWKTQKCAGETDDIASFHFSAYCQ